VGTIIVGIGGPSPTHDHRGQVGFGYQKLVATEITDPDEHARVFALAVKACAGYADTAL